MKKRLLSFILCVVLAVGACIGTTSCSNKSLHNDTEVTQQEVIDQIVESALDEFEVRIDDYIDVSYFVGLADSVGSNSSNHGKLLTTSQLSPDNDEMSLEAIQYDALTSSIENIFSDLDDDEYDAISTLAEEDDEIADLLRMVESDFDGFGYQDENSEITACSSKVVTLSTAVAAIGSLLLAQGLNTASVVTIKGSFSTVLAAIKAIFIPTWVKVALVSAAVIAITVVVVVNWNKIKPVFNDIVNIFANNAKSLASTVRSVFNRIRSNALSSAIEAAQAKVFTNEIIFEMSKYGLTKVIISSLIKEFTNLDLNSDNDDKTVYLGTWEDDYNLVASKDKNGVSFHVDDDTWTKYVLKYSREGLWLVNKAFLNYVIYKRWEIVLVTNPYSHYNLATHTKLNDRMYARELELLANRGATWRSEGLYWRVNKAW